jgi:hypothetical protein
LCIFTRNNTETKEVEYLKGLGKEKVFEISAVKLSEIDTILACIYISPDSDFFYKFLHKLELLILKVSSKGKCLILCGDLNVNFIQYTDKLLDLQNLLIMNNLINVLKSPTRISNNSASLIDVLIVNSIKNECFTTNLDLGYSDYLAQLLYIKLKNLLKGPITTYKRFFTGKNVEQFQYLLQIEKWDEVSASNEPNTSFNIFTDTFRYYFNIDTFRYYFNIAFPVKATYVKESIVNKWITKGIIVSKNRLRLLCNTK